MLRRSGVEYKSLEQILAMRRAGLVVADIHAALREATRPGITTAELDEVAAGVLTRAGAQSNFLGYYGYPAHVCISVNEEVVHGIPGSRRIQAGDVVSFDCGAVVEGWHGDAAFTIVLDEADAADLALSEATRKAMWNAIAAVATGSYLSVVGAAVEDTIAAHRGQAAGRLSIIEEYVGHGIGTAMHQPPDVFNYRSSQRGLRLRPGLCLAIEPMITRGGSATEVLDDEWTVVTSDGSRAAHWEHTVALTEQGPWVLTAPDGGRTELASRGVAIAEV